jgi:hypothetical protein
LRVGGLGFFVFVDVFHDCVGIRKALKATVVSGMIAEVSPATYNAGSAGEAC